MQTYLVEVKDITGLRILQELEQAKIIKLIQTVQKKDLQNLSSRLRGSLSKETAQNMKEEIEQMRNEWKQRDI